MTCKECNCEYEKWIPEGAYENNLCLKCNEKKWTEFEKEHGEDFKRIDEIVKQGHSEHCACRQVWGDGECTCDLEKAGYDPYAWMKI